MVTSAFFSRKKPGKEGAGAYEQTGEESDGEARVRGERWESEGGCKLCAQDGGAKALEVDREDVCTALSRLYACIYRASLPISPSLSREENTGI